MVSLEDKVHLVGVKVGKVTLSHTMLLRGGFRSDGGCHRRPSGLFFGGLRTTLGVNSTSF